MSSIQKITIVGNSVGLRVRPSEEYPKNKSYSVHLQESLKTEGIVVENISKGASTIKNHLENIDEIINKCSNIYIINLGVVDSTIREVPLWFYRIATKKYGNLLNRITFLIYHNIISKLRPFFSTLRGRRSWISKKKFRLFFSDFLDLIIKESNAKILVLSINIANERIEKQLQGSQENQNAFNEIMKDETLRRNQVFIDLSDLKSDIHFPDGVHFNSLGHQLVAERILSALDISSQ